MEAAEAYRIAIKALGMARLQAQRDSQASRESFPNLSKSHAAFADATRDAEDVIARILELLETEALA